jgi:hypothetical protein
MNSRSLIRLSAQAALFGGLLRIASSLVAPDTLGEAAELLYLVIDLALLAALLGIYLHRHEALGRLGFAAFAVSLPALAVIVGPDGELYGVDVYRAGGGLLVLGLALLAVAQLRARVGRTWSSIGWLGAFAMTLLGVLLPNRAWPFVAAGLAFGAAFVAASFELRRNVTAA